MESMMNARNTGDTYIHPNTNSTNRGKYKMVEKIIHIIQLYIDKIKYTDCRHSCLLCEFKHDCYREAFYERNWKW